MRTRSLLWEVDVDELWTAEQLVRGRELFLAHPDRRAAYYRCHYFVGPDLVVATRDGYGNGAWEWLRTWRYRPGDRWLAHEPPILATRFEAWRQWKRRRRGRRPKPPFLPGDPRTFSRDETEREGLVFQHLAYVLERQVRFKERYYGYPGAVDRWRAMQAATAFPTAAARPLPVGRATTPSSSARPPRASPPSCRSPSGPARRDGRAATGRRDREAPRERRRLRRVGVRRVAARVRGRGARARRAGPRRSRRGTCPWTCGSSKDANFEHLAPAIRAANPAVRELRVVRGATGMAARLLRRRPDVVVTYHAPRAYRALLRMRRLPFAPRPAVLETVHERYAWALEPFDGIRPRAADAYVLTHDVHAAVRHAFGVGDDRQFVARPLFADSLLDLDDAARAEGRALRAAWGVPSGAVVVGYLGRLGDNKGLPQAIDVVRRLARAGRDVHLVLAGRPCPELAGFDARLAATVATANASDPRCRGRFHLVGVVPHRRPTYAAFDLLLLAARTEGLLPLMLVEGMSTGLPAVTTDVGGIAQCLRDGVDAEVVAEGPRRRTRPDARRGGRPRRTAWRASWTTRGVGPRSARRDTCACARSSRRTTSTATPAAPSAAWVRVRGRV